MQISIVEIGVAFLAKFLARLAESSIEFKQIPKQFFCNPIAWENTEWRFFISIRYFAAIQLINALFMMVPLSRPQFEKNA